MALILCSHCGHRVSTNAPKCPQCGTPPKRTRYRYWFGPPKWWNPYFKGWPALPFVLLLLFVKILNLISSLPDAPKAIDTAKSLRSDSLGVVLHYQHKDLLGSSYPSVEITAKDDAPIVIERVLFNGRTGVQNCDFDYSPHDEKLNTGDTFKINTPIDGVPRACGDKIVRVEIYTDRGAITYTFDSEEPSAHGPAGNDAVVKEMRREEGTESGARTTRNYGNGRASSRAATARFNGAMSSMQKVYIHLRMYGSLRLCLLRGQPFHFRQTRREHSEPIALIQKHA